ncbi:MAG: hypothetical protein HYZ92_00220 [Candidatus Omnitrophica bacterium]|nr:hypothetical protein [Candidatus Omnitrophota bacterium]
MAPFTVTYDKRRDTLYVSRRGTHATLNVVWGLDETLRLDPDTCEAAGWTITNFSLHYPKLASYVGPRKRWFISDYFETRAHDLNRLLAPIRSRRALVDFLTAEAASLSSHQVHVKTS